MRNFICGDGSYRISFPCVMGILNITPDSFYDGGRYQTILEIAGNALRMAEDGAAIIDIGAVSTRPGALDVTQDEEIARLTPVLKEIRHQLPGMILSVDTFRPEVARVAAGLGADMINDIYAGRFDSSMMATTAELGLPYIIMHMQGTPGSMQLNPAYENVTAEVEKFLEEQISCCKRAGIRHVIADPGFGFGKTVEHNFTLLAGLDRFKSLGVPVLVGISRKSMINKVLNTTPDHALNGTTVLNTVALMKGADILRVHDVKEATEAIKLTAMLAGNQIS